MRIQITVVTEDAGFCTCNKCFQYKACTRLSISSSKEPIGSRVLCLHCINGGLAEIGVVFEKETAYTSAQRKRSNKKARKSEEKTAYETGGTCTGYFPNAGDSRTSGFFFEDKTKTSGDRKSYRLTEEVVLKGRSQAQKAGLTPVFRIHLKNVSIGVMLWDDLINLVREEP